MPFGLPKPSDITAQLNDKFGQLIAELQTMQGILSDILAEVKKQNVNQGGTTP
jgi:hypothetical protein